MDARHARRIAWTGLAAVVMLGAAGMTWRCRRNRPRSGAITASPTAAATAQAEGPPTIQIPPERQQQIGVKFAVATRVPSRSATVR